MFECKNCNTIFTKKHHLVNHLNKKKKCISKDIQGKVFTLVINGKSYQVHNTSDVELTNKLIEFIGKSNFKDISNDHIEKQVIIPDIKLHDIPIINQNILENEIDLDERRAAYIEKIKKFFFLKKLKVAKTPMCRKYREVSLKSLNQVDKEKLHEIKKAMLLTNIPDEYVYEDEDKDENKPIEKITDSKAIEKFINKSIKLSEEIYDIELKQFELHEIDGEYDTDNFLTTKRTMLFNIKQTLKISGVDISKINYKKFSVSLEVE